MRSPIRIVHGWSSLVPRHALSLLEKANLKCPDGKGVLIMKLRLSLQCAATAVGCLVATPIPAQPITSFDPPGSRYTQPTSINPAGEITGYYYASDNTAHGFVRHASGTITSFDAPGATSTLPNSINPTGEITGWYGANGHAHGFVRDASGTITSFDAPGALGTGPTSINPAGEITGSYTGSDGHAHSFGRDASGTSTTFSRPQAT